MTRRFADGDRGDRLRPARSHRGYVVLSHLATAIRRAVAALPAGDVLDLGCAHRPYEGIFMDRGFRYVGADLPGNARADMVLTAEGKVSGSPLFDYVLSTQTLEHVRDPQTYLREAHRLLKGEGRLILSTHGIYQYHPDPDDYWRWTCPGLRLELSRAGFIVEHQEGILNGLAAVIQLWQDVTIRRMPVPSRPLYRWICQRVIGLCARRQCARPEQDACVYVVVARKAAA